MINKCIQTHTRICGIESNAPLFIHTYKLVSILKGVQHAEKTSENYIEYSFYL